ncbi:hypothetical protein HMPREF9098_2065 [Kingella denitrificans ATCC 33394]|uniref:Uncharacterized protein n=1 Tax=Kingella denitrificans ATCC 33394 TaxID=888741 RepID=F0F1T0_9NEIS|nr:hypothetical protein HMPREF9098_2065 [Kingella denitrificans ATCC 33394]
MHIGWLSQRFEPMAACTSKPKVQAAFISNRFSPMPKRRARSG